MPLLLAQKKRIDDIDVYFEIYAKGALADDFCEKFVTGAFVAPCDNCLVMLHGNGESVKIFSENVEALCHDNYCILVDSRAHGRSDMGSQELTIDLMSEDISKLCDELNLGKFKLLGFSDGGNIALTYAVRHPERLSHLVVAGSNLNPSGLKFFTRFSIWIKYIFSLSSKNKNEKCLLRYQLLSLMINYPHISSRLLGNVICPSLVIEGKRDVIKRSHTRIIAQSLKNSTLSTVPCSGHNVFVDNPDFVNDIVLRFIG